MKEEGIDMRRKGGSKGGEAGGKKGGRGKKGRGKRAE